MAYQPPAMPADPGQVAPYAQTAYANWLYRVGATLIDSIIVSVIYFIGNLIGRAIGSDPATGTPTGAGLAVYLVFVLAGIGFAIWNLFIRQGSTGQTIGKSVVGTRLISEQSGQPIGAGMAFLRQICHILDSLACYIGYLWPLWDAKRQTFADKIVHTVVVRA